MDQAIINRALEFATDRHGGQVRYPGSARPYIEHPEEAAEVLVAAGVTDPEVITAALLHDTVEDTDTTLDEIKERFGDHVSALVDDLTEKFTEEAYPGLADNQRDTRELERLVNIRQKSRQIKIADLISNIRSFAQAAPDIAFDFFNWAERVLDAFAAIKLNNSAEDQIEATLRRQARNELLVVRRRVQTRMQLPTSRFPESEQGRGNPGRRRSP